MFKPLLYCVSFASIFYCCLSAPTNLITDTLANVVGGAFEELIGTYGTLVGSVIGTIGGGQNGPELAAQVGNAEGRALGQFIQDSVKQNPSDGLFDDFTNLTGGILGATYGLLGANVGALVGVLNEGTEGAIRSSAAGTVIGLGLGEDVIRSGDGCISDGLLGKVGDFASDVVGSAAGSLGAAIKGVPIGLLAGNDALITEALAGAQLGTALGDAISKIL